MKTLTEENIDDLMESKFGTINDMATSYILRWVDKKFNPIYWVENNHGSIDYDEMVVLVLTIFKSEIKMFLPLTFENEIYLRAYEEMEKSLDKKELKKLNAEYIDIHEIELSVIRKDTVLILKNYFKEYKKKEKRNVK